MIMAGLIKLILKYARCYLAKFVIWVCSGIKHFILTGLLNMYAGFSTLVLLFAAQVVLRSYSIDPIAYVLSKLPHK